MNQKEQLQLLYDNIVRNNDNEKRFFLSITDYVKYIDNELMDILNNDNNSLFSNKEELKRIGISEKAAEKSENDYVNRCLNIYENLKKQIITNNIKNNSIQKSIKEFETLTENRKITESVDGIFLLRDLTLNILLSFDNKKFRKYIINEIQTESELIPYFKIESDWYNYGDHVLEHTKNLDSSISKDWLDLYHVNLLIFEPKKTLNTLKSGKHSHHKQTVISEWENQALEIQNIINEIQDDIRQYYHIEDYLGKINRIHTFLNIYLINKSSDAPYKLPETAVRTFPNNWKWENKKEGKYLFGNIPFQVTGIDRKNVFTTLLDLCKENPTNIPTQLIKQQAGIINGNTLYSIIKGINQRLETSKVYHSFDSLSKGFYYLNKKR